MNYLWRLFVTAFCFSYFGLGAIFLSLVVFPILSILSFSETNLRSRMRAVIQSSFRLFFAILHNARLFDFQVEGLEKVKGDRGVILVANHPSLIDVVSLISLMPNVSCIVKKALFENFFLKGVVLRAGYIPNDESEGILELCKVSLERGDNIIIFPEGTRSIPGKAMSLKRGAAQIAVRLGVPVRVAKITVNPPTLTKGAPWYKIPPRRALFKVEFLERIETKCFLDNGVKSSIAARRVTSEIRQKIDSSLQL
ncbi:MAG: lysophospholipid acyltransferase family protein [Bdellovibrionota bacterium]|nr:lysophospholipid acyltransferase family protein [Bdellovibrionota bacterium]